MDLDPNQNPTGSNGFGPQRVRALRGELTRAAFARRVGVTPQTVYRWELADGAREARRPRGAELERLERLERGSEPAPPPPPDGDRSQNAWVDDDVLRVLPSLERVVSGDARRGHTELLSLLASSHKLSPNARATACFGIALFELTLRANARAALLAISPALSDAEERRLSPAVATKVYAVAALIHAQPDAMLFDIGRVHGYSARVAPSAAEDHEAAAVSCIAELCSAMQVGDNELLERGFRRLAEARWHGLPPLLAIHVDEFMTVRSVFSGEPAGSIETYEALAARAESAGYAMVLARCLARTALGRLDSLADPEAVLALVRRAKAVSSGAQLGPGFHRLHALKAEIEALIRLGRIDEALLARDELERWWEETGMPPLAVAAVETRLLQITGKSEALEALAARVRGCEIPSMRPICEAYASYAEAMVLLIRSDQPARTIAAFEKAEKLAERWPYLLREVTLHRVTAHAVAGEADAGRAALRRAQRVLDRLPSTWASALLRRLEGGLLASSGLWTEARVQLEAAIAAFELAHDTCDAVVTRYVLVALADTCEVPNPEGLAEARNAVEALGIHPPRGLEVGIARFRAAARPARVPSEGPPLEPSRLLVSIQRLSVRGAAPVLILRELAAVALGLFPGRAVYIEELDSAGSSRPVFGPVRAGSQPVEWSEFSDGAGRMLRLGVAGALGSEQRSALALLTVAAALSLEAASLRGYAERSETTGVDDRSPELPGFVAASPGMRRLRSELTRLAASRATVIITGESGSGKELVARAIHDLSERAGQSYVAFNCATVPRDLFEGQLFGYRRGAFTGAHSDQPGVIRAASGGTLFLDELGELPLDIQPKLLRFLENGEVFPLGGQKPVRVDVRVLAATHRDLATLVREGKFREDLYYRLQVVPVHVPPLRERREDIPVLARHFVRQLARSGEPPVLSPDALSALVAHDWPGNVRELRNVIERALALSPGVEVLRASDLRLLARAS
jgi:Sigma-54 interaction domain